MSTVVNGSPESDSLQGDPVARRRGRLVGRTVVTGAVAMFAALSVFFGVFAFGLSGLQEHRAQRQLYAEFRGLIDPSSPLTRPDGGVIAAGTPVALLNSSAARWHDLVAVEGTTSSNTEVGPGHLRDSPLPGQPGDAVLIGRSVTAGGPFSTLTRLRVGDTVSVVTAQGRFRFRVIDTRRGGDPLPYLPASGSMITMITATGQGWWGSLDPTRLLYVDAALVGTPLSAPQGRPAVVTAAEVQGRGDPGAWPDVVVWLEVVLGVVLGVVWLWSRWPWWRAWLISAPVLIASFWGLSVEVLRLLPNVV